MKYQLCHQTIHPITGSRFRFFIMYTAPTEEVYRSERYSSIAEAFERNQDSIGGELYDMSSIKEFALLAEADTIEELKIKVAWAFL